MGILMIIFASLGLLVGLIGLGGKSMPDEFKDIHEFKTFASVSMIFTVIGLAISAIHLIAGVSSVRYKANAPKLASMYALINILATIANAIVVLAWLKPALQKAVDQAAGGHALFDVGALIGGMVVVGTIIGLIWPTLVLILMSRPAAKAACTN
jgi:hypothetical protein